MMNATELCAAYADVARKHGLPPIAPADLQIEPRDFADPEAAWGALHERKPVEGWVLFQSHVATFLAGALPEPDPAWGCLLAAEALDADGRSIHVRQSETGRLQLTIATPLAAADVEDLFLADNVRHLATDKAPGVLCHRRYWRVDPTMGVVPVFAAFQGFARPEDI